MVKLSTWKKYKSTILWAIIRGARIHGRFLKRGERRSRGVGLQGRRTPGAIQALALRVFIKPITAGMMETMMMENIIIVKLCLTIGRFPK